MENRLMTIALYSLTLQTLVFVILNTVSSSKKCIVKMFLLKCVTVWRMHISNPDDGCTPQNQPVSEKGSHWVMDSCTELQQYWNDLKAFDKEFIVIISLVFIYWVSYDAGRNEGSHEKLVLIRFKRHTS